MAECSSLEASRSIHVMRMKVVECSIEARRTSAGGDLGSRPGPRRGRSISMIPRRPCFLAVVALAVGSACGTNPANETPSGDGGTAPTDVAAPDGPEILNKVQFPPGFLFGTAIAGFQADMGCP